MKVSDVPVKVKQQFNLPIDIVWDAITQHNQMIKWFFEQIPDFSAEVGFKTQFNVEAPTRDFLHLWEIIDVIPLKHIVYNWKYKGLKGDSTVSFELTYLDNITELSVTTKVLEDFDDSIQEFKRESCLGGWNYFIKDRLFHYLKVRYA